MKTIDNEEFIEACKNGDLAEVKCVLENSLWGAAASSQMFDNMAAVITAAGCGHLELVQYLVEKTSRYGHQADLAARDASALVQAASNGHLDVVRYLVEMKCILQTPYLMADKHLAICVAVENGYVAVVKYLSSTFSQP